MVYDMWDPRSVGHASRRLLSYNAGKSMRIETCDNGKYFCASTIINKYELSHTVNIIYMGF